MTEIKFYFDEHLARSIGKGLIERGHTVVMATDAAMSGQDDDTGHLPYATENEMVVVTCDRPFAGRTEKRSDHGGLVCLSEQLRRDIGAAIRALDQFAQEKTLEDVRGKVFWLK
ncbi:MAG: DUF5615 family PIN-like protein [Anaerolineae bacterium]